jgi:hypothetical protein
MTLFSRARFAAAAVLFNAVFAAAASAQTAPWTSLRTHSPASALQRLPETERAAIYKILRPELGPLFQGDATSVTDGAIRSFRTERINLGGASAIAVQPGDGELCGANGNCSFWIIDLLHRRVLLRAEGVQSYAVESDRPHGMREVITAAQESATEQERIRWTFQAGHYEPQSCASIEYADHDGTQLAQPKVTPHPCSPEGN